MKKQYLRTEPIRNSDDLILINEIDVFVGVISLFDFCSFCGDDKEVREFDGYTFWNVDIDNIKRCLKDK